MARPEKSQLIRINKFLAESGICSRRKADELIRDGLIKINGKICLELGAKVDPNEDRVVYKGKRVKPTESYVYIAFNKPKNVVTTTSDPEGRPSVLDYFEKQKERIYPVGRLDWATEGLLLMTNDGQFSHSVASPKSKVPKTYIAKLDGKPTGDHLDRLRNGVSIEGGGKVKALSVKRITHGSSDKYGWVQITINEGKNRQIRKMFAKVGFDVKKLQRVSIGGLRLGRLKTGQYKVLTRKELEKVFDPQDFEPAAPTSKKTKKKPSRKTSNKKTTQRPRSVKKR